MWMRWEGRLGWQWGVARVRKTFPPRPAMDTQAPCHLSHRNLLISALPRSHLRTPGPRTSVFWGLLVALNSRSRSCSGGISFSPNPHLSPPC